MKSVIATKNAPAAIGPYSQGINTGDLLFTSGQIPLIPDGSELVCGIENQTRQVMENLKAILEAGGVGLENIVKTTIFLTDLKNFSVVNEIYAGYFSNEPPARSTIQVAALPMGAEIEIEAIAKGQ